MRALIDTCVVIDALQNREPFAQGAQTIFLLCAQQQLEGFLTAKALTDIYYLSHRQTHSDPRSREILSRLCTLFRVLDTSAQDIHNAIAADIPDFEDAVMVETACRTGMDCIVTRNTRDYRAAKLPVYTPDECAALLLPPECEE